MNTAMKTVWTFGILTLLAGAAQAQPILVSKAADLLKNKQIDAAKTAIDAASVNPASVNDPRTWYYKGFIYKELFKQDPVKNQDARVQSVDFFKKSISLDKTNEYTSDCKQNVRFIANTYLQDGTDLFNTKQYKEVKTPLRAYANHIRFAEPSAFNSEIYSFIGFAEEMTGGADSAIFYYEKALTAGFHDALLFDNLANLYHDKHNDAKAIQVLEKGIKLYPSDGKLAISEVNILMASNKVVEAETKIEKAIALNPKNIDLYLVQGTALDRLAKLKPTDKEKYFDKRLTAYQKVLEIDPNHFSANYNMGITLYNRAVDIINDQSYDLDVTLLTKVIDDCSILFKRAMPYLEKAHKLTPTNKNTLVALEGIYYNLSDAEKMKTVQGKLSNMK
jgi:tetratricopeptide (TPR) repeat protein